MLALGICLAYVLWAQKQGMKAAEFVPVTMLVTAAIYAMAAGATFALLEGARNTETGSAAPK